jgi:hypothetical protein
MDGGNVILLSNKIDRAKRVLKNHFVDVINSPEEYSEEQKDNVNLILNKEYDNFIDLQVDYNNFDILGEWIMITEDSI